jgi:hypothetical protein
MRLQRGKIERERLKQAAEHAFDYTAPPPPKNMQAISELALPASSRVMSSKKKSTKSTRSSNVAQDDKIRATDCIDSSNNDNQKRISRASLETHHSLLRHMSPAVAAALAKAQTIQSIPAMPAKLAAGNNDLEPEVAEEVNAVSSNPSQSVSSPSSPHLRKNMHQHVEQVIEAHQDLKDQIQASNAAKKIIELHRPSRRDASVATAYSSDAIAQLEQIEQIAPDTHQYVDAQNDSELKPSIGPQKIEGEKGNLMAETSRQGMHQVAANPLQQLVMLLNFNDNRYGDNDSDAAHGHCIISTLQNLEIGGSNSHEEFTSNSARENYARSSPEYPTSSCLLTCLRLKLPMLEDESSLNFTKVIFYLEDNQNCNRMLKKPHLTIFPLSNNCSPQSDTNGRNHSNCFYSVQQQGFSKQPSMMLIFCIGLVF